MIKKDNNSYSTKEMKIDETSLLLTTLYGVHFRNHLNEIMRKSGKFARVVLRTGWAFGVKDAQNLTGGRPPVRKATNVKTAFLDFMRFHLWEQCFESK